MKKINKPTKIEVEGNKIIEEFIGLVNSGDKNISVAKMISPKGWSEPGQTPSFSEYTIVLRGVLNVKTKDVTTNVYAGEAIIINKNEWVQYSSPHVETEYIAICLPAFSIGTVYRDK